MPIVNKDQIRDLTTAFRANFNQVIEGEKGLWGSVAMEVPSNSSRNTYPWLKEIPNVREWVGDRHINNLAQNTYTIENKRWELTLGVDVDDIADDQFSVYGPMFQHFNESVAKHVDELVFETLEAGFTTTIYDGQFFFDTDHPVLDANGQTISVSNFTSGANPTWYLFDNSKALKALIYQTRERGSFVEKTSPTDDNVFFKDQFIFGMKMRHNAGYGFWQTAYASQEILDTTSFSDARAAMRRITGDYDKKLGIRPTLLMVAPEQEQAALELINAERLANGATNVNRSAVQVLVNPFLS